MIDAPRKCFFVSGIMLLTSVLLAGSLFAQAGKNMPKPVCNSEYKGIKPTEKQLKKILARHKEWFNDFRARKASRQDERKANLCMANLENTNLSGAGLDEANLSGANLGRANLRGADLEYANLSGANLENANLSDILLIKADLSGANLWKANLSGANLEGSHLSGAFLMGANLSGANLGGANLSGANLCKVNLSGIDLEDSDLSSAILVRTNLSGANLWNANLSGANLEGSDLSSANMRNANLKSVIFELKPGALPDIPSIGLAKNLSEMKYLLSPHSLVELREALKNAGLRQREREIVYVIEHTNRQLAWKKFRIALNIPLGMEWREINHVIKYTRQLARGVAGLIEGFFKFILFEITSDYGMSPGRPLLIIIGLILIFSIPYVIALRPKGRAGIWQEWSKDRVRKDEGKEEPVRLSAKGLRRRMWIGLHFSVLSAFYIGWRDLNVGYWIIRMQPHEYVLRATGWVRTVSGLQSLISVYLLALSVLTYFGRPFE